MYISLVIIVITEITEIDSKNNLTIKVNINSLIITIFAFTSNIYLVKLDL